MAGFLFLGKCFPLILGFLRKLSPLLPDDLGYIGVSESWILRHHCCLVVLAIENECISRSRDLGIRLTEAELGDRLPWCRRLDGTGR